MISKTIINLIRKQKKYPKLNFCSIFNPESFTQNLKFTKSAPTEKSFQMMDFEGNYIHKESHNIDTEKLNKIYETMIKVHEIDEILYKVQRQGKISFYMTSFGETASVIGSAAGLNDEDWIFPQYREQGAIVWRGFSVLG